MSYVLFALLVLGIIAIFFLDNEYNGGLGFVTLGIIIIAIIWIINILDNRSFIHEKAVKEYLQDSTKYTITIQYEKKDSTFIPVDTIVTRN